MTQAGSYAEPFLRGSHLQAPRAGAESSNWALDALRLMVDTMTAVLGRWAEIGAGVDLYSKL